MKHRVEYKGFLIHAAPHEVKDTGQLVINVFIMREAGHFYRKRQFKAKNGFPTEEQALEQSVDFARQIIDGNVEGCSVEDL